MKNKFWIIVFDGHNLINYAETNTYEQAQEIVTNGKLIELYLVVQISLILDCWGDEK